MPDPRLPTLTLHQSVFERNLNLLERTVDGIEEDAAARPLIPGGSHLLG